MDSLSQSRRARNRARRRQLGRVNAWHMAAFTGSIAGTAGTQVNALSDDILRIDQTNGFMMPTDMLLLYGQAMSALLLRAYLTSPKILQTNPVYIRPVGGAATPSNPQELAWWGPNFIGLRGQEDLLAYVTNSGAGPSQTTILVGVTPQVTPIPAGTIYTVYGTSTTAAVANTWTTISYTMATALPAGLYSMVGSDVQSTNAIAHRWIFSNQVWRPGFSGVNTLVVTPSFLRAYRWLGEMGQFFQYDLPRLQVLVNGTDNAHDIYMDLIKVG